MKEEIRKICNLIILILILFPIFSFAQNTSNEIIGKLAIPGALRECPSTDCKIIRYYAETAKVKIIGLDDSNKWYQVIANDDYGNKLNGWMHYSIFVDDYRTIVKNLLKNYKQTITQKEQTTPSPLSGENHPSQNNWVILYYGIVVIFIVIIFSAFYFFRSKIKDISRLKSNAIASLKIKLKQTRFINSLFIVLVIMAGIIGIGYGIVYYRVSKLLKNAEQLTKDEKYNEAIGKLEAAQNEWFIKNWGVKKHEINNEIEKNKKLLEDKSEYIHGVEEFNKGNWEKAKELLSKVSEISPYYQDAKSKIEEAQNKIINEKIAKAVNKAKTEIKNQQNTQSIESPSLSQNNQNQKEQNSSTGQSNEITSADLQKILPYIGHFSCGASNLYGDYTSSEGSASLWVLKGRGAFILTNYHVIEPTIGSYPAGCVVWLDKGCYVVDIQRIPSSASNNFLDFAFLKITSTCHCDSSDCLQFPPPESLSSEELLSIPPCPTKMPLGSPVAVIGYPITTKSRIDFENLFGQRESALVPNKTVTTGIISAHDSNPIYNGYSDVNYFVSAKIDKGNSGGLAFSKYNGRLCILGVPTWVERGYFENMGVVQSFHNIWNF